MREANTSATSEKWFAFGLQQAREGRSKLDWEAFLAVYGPSYRHDFKSLAAWDYYRRGLDTGNAETEAVLRVDRRATTGSGL